MNRLSLQDIPVAGSRDGQKIVPPRIPSDMDRRVQIVIKFMEVYLDRPLSLNDLARSVNLSPWRLSHIFKSETRTPPLQYLRTLRMQQAKVLLETTFLSVKQIMTEVGVRDGSHFVRDFKTTYGLSPTRYRQSFFRIFQ
jgi:transcriptional regulator GlxA family with amidase domain